MLVILCHFFFCGVLRESISAFIVCKWPLWALHSFLINFLVIGNALSLPWLCDYFLFVSICRGYLESIESDRNIMFARSKETLEANIWNCNRWSGDGVWHSIVHLDRSRNWPALVTHRFPDLWLSMFWGEMSEMIWICLNCTVYGQPGKHSQYGNGSSNHQRIARQYSTINASVVQHPPVVQHPLPSS